MAIPEGLEKCPKCGEYKGKAKTKDLNWEGSGDRERNEKSEELLSFICWCDSVLCPQCGKGRIRRPVSNRYIEAENRLSHAPYFIAMGGCSACKEKHEQEEIARREEHKPEMTETHYPGLTFASIGPFQGRRPNSCMAPQWVQTYGLSKLREMLVRLGVKPEQHDIYESYFRELWERRKATPPVECDPHVLREVDAFTDKLRATKRGIFRD